MCLLYTPVPCPHALPSKLFPNGTLLKLWSSLPRDTQALGAALRWRKPFFVLTEVNLPAFGLHGGPGSTWGSGEPSFPPPRAQGAGGLAQGESSGSVCGLADGGPTSVRLCPPGATFHAEALAVATSASPQCVCWCGHSHVCRGLWPCQGIHPSSSPLILISAVWKVGAVHPFVLPTSVYRAPTVCHAVCWGRWEQVKG